MNGQAPASVDGGASKPGSDTTLVAVRSLEEGRDSAGATGKDWS